MLEIVVSGSEKLLLQETKLFNDDDIISFSLLLCYGKIKNLKSKLIRKICGYNIDIKASLKELEEKVANYQNIRIWYSSLDNEDVCTLYFIINYFSKRRDLNFYICDAYDNEHYSLGSYFAEEVSRLINKTKKLTIKEITNYKDLWDKLECENGDLRIVSNDTLVSYNYDYLDTRIIELLNKYDSIYYWEFIGECLSLRLCNFYGDIFFTPRINEMIKKGKIVIVRVEKKKNFMGEEIDKKFIKVASN